jgi:hypothetical protein
MPDTADPERFIISVDLAACEIIKTEENVEDTAPETEQEIWHWPALSEVAAGSAVSSFVHPALNNIADSKREIVKTFNFMELFFLSL